MPVRMVWLLDGQTYDEGEATWEWGEEGNFWWWVGWEDPQQGQLDPGRYDVQLYVEGQLVQTGTFAVGEEVKGPSFGPVTFSSAFDDESEQPVNVGTVFNYGITELHAYWPYDGVDAGTYELVVKAGGAEILRASCSIE
jgi:hypothetical protein